MILFAIGGVVIALGFLCSDGIATSLGLFAVGNTFLIMSQLESIEQAIKGVSK